MIQQRTVEERLQMIEEYLLEIKLMLRPSSLSQKQVREQEVLMSVKDVAKLVNVDGNVVTISLITCASLSAVDFTLVDTRF